MSKKLILSKIHIDTDMFMTSFEDAAKILLEQKDILEKEGWSSIHLKMDYYNEGSELIVMGMRLENDNEYNERLKNEKNKLLLKNKKKERDIKKYNELKEKYGL